VEEVSPFLIDTLLKGQGIIVSDASVKDGKGSFAWILTDPQEKEKHIVRKIIEPPYDKLTSYRAEGCGIQDATRFLSRQKIPKQVPVTLYCDNL